MSFGLDANADVYAEVEVLPLVVVLQVHARGQKK